MVAVFSGNLDHQVYVALNLVTTVIGSLASLFTIFLIYRMKVNTGHVLLVLTMSYMQLFYDVTFFFSNVDVGYYITVVANFFQLVCGIGGSLVSNWIAFIALYIILYRRKFNIFANYYPILASCLIPGIVDVIIFMIAVVPEDSQNDELLDISILYYYYYVRLASIFLNFIFVFLAFYKINLMSSTTLNKSPQELAIRALARRLIFYPIVQAIGRSGYAWYEFQYGVTIDTDDPTTEQYTASIFLTIVTPCVSVGYLIIFLYMQPRAYEEFKQMIYCRSFTLPTEENLSRNGTNSVTRSQSSTTDPIHRLTTDTLGYFTDGGGSRRDSESSVRKNSVDGNIELSMAEVARTSDGSMNPIANQTNAFAAYEDDELMTFIVESEKNSRHSFGTDIEGDRSTMDPPRTRSAALPSGRGLFSRSSLTPSGSITTTVSGGNSLLAKFRSHSKEPSSHQEKATTMTENPIFKTKQKRVSTSVLTSIQEENESKQTKTRATSREKTRSVSKSRTASKDPSRTTSKSVSNDKVPVIPLPTSSPSLERKELNRYSGYGPETAFYDRDSDFLAAARESVDAFYSEQNTGSEYGRDTDINP